MPARPLWSWRWRHRGRPTDLVRSCFFSGNPVTGVEPDGHRATDINHNDGSTDSTSIQVPHCYDISCGAWQARQDTVGTDSGDGGDWVGGVAASFLEAAATSTPLLKAAPGPHPFVAARDGFNDLVGANTSTDTYRRGHGAGDGIMLLGSLLTLGGTSTASGAPLIAERFIQTAHATRVSQVADSVPTALTNGTQFEVLSSQAVSGVTRASHRATREQAVLGPTGGRRGVPTIFR